MPTDTVSAACGWESSCGYRSRPPVTVRPPAAAVQRPPPPPSTPPPLRQRSPRPSVRHCPELERRDILESALDRPGVPGRDLGKDLEEVIVVQWGVRWEIP